MQLAYLLLLLSLALVGCAPVVEDATDKSSSSPTDGQSDTGALDTAAPGPALELDFSAFDAEVEAIMAEHDLEGATVAIVHREAGVVHERAYGAFEVDHRAIIASSAKIISAGVLLHLADAGLLDLDAPVSEQIGDWGDREHDPTVAQLLSNSSGLVGLDDKAAYPPYLCMLSDETTLQACGQAIYTAPDERVTVPPDTEYRYGGAQWQLAGAIAEAVSGQSWNTLIDELYVQPCGPDGLAYGNPYREVVEALVDAREATYPEGGLPLEPSDNPNIEGGAYTSAGDYGRLLLMHLQGGACPGGRVLSEASVARMQEDRIAEWGGSVALGPADYPLEGYGLGWWLDRTAPGFVSDPGAFGATPWIDVPRGYGVMILVEDSVDMGIVFLDRLAPLSAAAFDEAAGR